MEPKPLLKDLTVVFNIVYLVVVVVSQLGFTQFVPDQNIKDLAIILPLVVNIILRFVTPAQPVSIKKLW